MWTYILAFWYFSYYWILIKFNCLAFNMHLTISSCLDIDHHQHKNRILNMRFRNKMQIWQDKKEFPTSSLNDSITDKNLKYYSPARQTVITRTSGATLLGTSYSDGTTWARSPIIRRRRHITVCPACLSPRRRVFTRELTTRTPPLVMSSTPASTTRLTVTLTGRWG